MTLPTCTVCGSADIIAVRPGVEGEKFADLFAVRRHTPDTGWCATHWPHNAPAASAQSADGEQEAGRGTNPAPVSEPIAAASADFLPGDSATGGQAAGSGALHIFSQPVSALYVETDGCYFGQPGVDPWDITRDARSYAGPHPVVAHPPCQRWGRFWRGSVRPGTKRFELGADDGCFAAALAAVRRFGGVLEHPAYSRAWEVFGIHAPKRGVGWRAAGDGVGWTCYVEQGHYGHISRKPTWLYAAHCDLPELNWSIGEQRIHPRALELHGYEKARRIGMIAMIGGKDKTRLRNATPPEFRDVLLAIARCARPHVATPAHLGAISPNSPGASASGAF